MPMRKRRTISSSTPRSTPPRRARAAGAPRSTGSSSRARTFRRPFGLAGGLDPDNVARAIKISRRELCRRLVGRRGRAGPARARTRSRPSSPPRETLRTRTLQARHERRAPEQLPPRSRRHGHFGDFGGRFVAETLMPLLLRAGAGVQRGEGRSRVSCRAQRAAEALCRPAQSALFRRAPDATSRRREDLFQARGPQPHRRAQDQQLPRPDPARQAHGQDAHHRRDRRGPARRRHRDGRRAASGFRASSTWAKSTSSGRSRTCSA